MEKEYLDGFKIILRTIKEFDEYDDFLDCILNNKHLTATFDNFLTRNSCSLKDKTWIEKMVNFLKCYCIKDVLKNKSKFSWIIPTSKKGNDMYDFMDDFNFNYKSCIEKRIEYLKKL